MSQYIELIKIDSLPGNVSMLADVANKKNVISKGLIKLNKKTKHLELESELPDDYYDEYLMTNTFSNAMQQLQDGQAKRLSELSNKGRFVEIGCGDGSFLNHAKKHFDQVVGIEPSRTFAVEAQQKGFEVIQKYVNEDTIFTDLKFDSFASRQVFEHLSDPLNVLKGIRNNLNPGAVGLIEVPNGLRSFLESRYYDFFPDHCQYYSVHSLTQLASDAGFVVLSCNTSFGDDYLELWMKYEPNLDSYAQKLLDVRNHTIDSLQSFINNSSQKGKKLAIWGVGAKTLATFANISEAKSIAFAIDSDPHKHDKFIPGTAIQVNPPTYLKTQEVDVIIILALSYREEIKQAILELSSRSCEIWTINNASQLVQL